MATSKTSRRKSGTKRRTNQRKVSPLLEFAGEWPYVTRKYMFGCDALLASGRLFCLELDGSIVLRVGREHLERALSVKGAEGWNPWSPGKPGDWVRFPPARRSIPKGLVDWAGTAYEGALSRKPSPKRRARTGMAPRAAVRRKG
jgi:TfoX/Sxy family transcriptional regulator of competence genes